MFSLPGLDILVFNLPNRPLCCKAVSNPLSIGLRFNLWPKIEQKRPAFTLLVIAHLVEGQKMKPLDLSSKIVYGLERISDALKALLWEKAKSHGISPVQIQLLLFIASHRIDLCNVTHLAREFNVTKPTVSDAVKVLVKKMYLAKDFSSADSRSYNLLITAKGEELVREVASYTMPLQKILTQTQEQQQKDLYAAVTVLIHQLNKSGVIQVQRSCFSCRFYSKPEQGHYCNLLEQALADTEIRLDCPEHQLQQ